MSNKRLAGNELTADNWDQTDEPEEIGTFRVASQEELQKRVVRTAKRRSNLTPNEEPVKGVFSNFGGFGKTPSSSSSSPFSFLSNIANGKNDPTKTAEVKPSNFSKETPKKSDVKKIEEKNVNSINHSDEYCANLKNLNQSVYEWIKSHIEKNPYCILTPIFDDYKKYLKDLDKYKTEAHSKDEHLESKPSNNFTLQNKEPAASSILFPATKTSIPETPKVGEKLDISKFNSPSNSLFSQGFSSTPVSKAPMFSFGQQSAAATSVNSNTSSGFSFGSGKPFSFGNIPQGEKKSENKPIDENEEDEEPPKTTFTPVVEEDSVYSKRCKVFVKNEGSFGDRGVGTLYLKPISGSEKCQLIVRADTSLGNLLINMVLSASIPTKRMGKNNVMLVTIPTPEAKPPPVPILLRVKTGEEADELLETLEKYKK